MNDRSACREPLRAVALSLGVSGDRFDQARTALSSVDANAQIRCGQRDGHQRHLNSNGTPFQLGLSHRVVGYASRLLYDAQSVVPANSRGGALPNDLGCALSPWHEAPIVPLVESIGAAFRQMGADSSWSSLEWVAGVSLDGRGAAVYVRVPQALPSAVWRVLDGWLKNVISAHAQARVVVRDLAKDALLVGVGVEGIDDGRGRIKLYWQLRSAMPLASVRSPFVNDTGIARFLNRAVGHTPIGLHALFFSTAFTLSSGELCDGKVDVCGHCVPRPLTAWLEIIDQTAAELGLNGSTIEAQGVELADALALEFIGLGIDRGGCYRLNVYLSERVRAESHMSRIQV